MKLKPHMHYPTLKTILMVEAFLKKHEGDLMSRNQILRGLPKKVDRQTLNTILTYLECSGKILDGYKGILWAYTPREEMEQMKKGALIF
jgi:hypothetical protein